MLMLVMLEYKYDNLDKINGIEEQVFLRFLSEDLESSRLRRALVDLWRGRKGLLVLKDLPGLSREEQLASKPFFLGGRCLRLDCFMGIMISFWVCNMV